MEFVPLLLLLLPAPAVSVQRLPTGAQDLRPQPLKVVVSSTCAPDGAGEREMHLDPDSPLVLTHRIRLLPGSGSGCGQCDMDFAALRERIERLEKEVSDLREKCGGPDGCCSSQQSKGSVCTTVRPETDECPDDCSDQGRCVDGKCVCFPGFSGPDCSIPDCPDDCSSRGRCVNGVCVCDPGFSGPDCSVKACPENCSNRGQCVNGKCVCDLGFSGQDCSSSSCPGDCSERGRCVNGRCVCDSGFAGPDCSERSCPGNCNARGRCVNGRCVCTSGFTGPDCSSRSCPGDCSERGQCVDGKCVCDSGFTGPDCSSRSCPGDCSNKGRCVDGKCVCDSGFSGPDCSSKTCPSSCSNRGRCVRGRCVCRRGFTGPDCSECQAGLTGENCDRALAGISGLSTRDITESSVTLSWTPTGPPYDSFHISFSSTKEAEQMVSRVGGGRSSFTQTGLAAGQQYSVSVSGERDGVMGAESTAQFSTLISGPKDLRVVKSSSTSVVVQWEPPQGRIDRYVLSVAPNQTDGARRPDISLPPERDSARIDGLLPGRLYELSLVAERDGGRSRPASVQASPGNVSVPETRMSLRPESEPEDGNHREKTQRFPNATLFLREHAPGKGGAAENSERAGNISRFKAGVPVRPGQRRPLPMGKHGMFPKPGTQPDIPRRPYSPGTKYLNSSQIAVKGGIVVPPSNRSITRRPLRPNAEPAHPDSGGKPLALTMMKETRSPKGSMETQRSSAMPLPSTRAAESTDPTVTAERNLTAYINGTKCVRKVLVGYRKIQGSASDGSVLSKNMSVIVGHVNGNELLHKLLTGRSEIQPKAERSVKERGGEDEERADATGSWTRRPETTLNQPLTPPPPHTSTSTSARPERAEQHTAGTLPASALPVPRPRHAALSAPALVGRPQFMSSYSRSSVEAQKDKRPSWPSAIASGLAKEALAEMKATREMQDSTPALPHKPSSEATALPVKLLLKQDRGVGASDLMPFRRAGLRASLPRRPNPSVFHDRTRPVPQLPSRGPMRRAFPSKHSGTISQASPIRPVKPALTPARGNGTSVRINRTNAAASTHPQIKPSGTSPHGNSDRSPPAEHLMESLNKTQESVLSDTAGSVEHVRVNATSTGLVLTWAAPKDKFRHFIITQTELEPENKHTDGMEEGEGEGTAAENSLSGGKAPITQMKSGGSVITVLPGSARSHPVPSLIPHSRYSLSIFGKGPAFRSKTHSLIVHTGPAPPSDLVFSDVTDRSFTVSWTKPKGKVSGFKVTHTHLQEGEPISASVDSETLRLVLSPLSPGSTYEVAVMSLLGADESEPVRDSVSTLPDAPTDLRVMNVTDSGALLLWRPALAAVDHYIIAYSSDTEAPGSGITVRVSGNAAEQQLQALRSSTQYSVSVQSRLSDRSSAAATAGFTTTGKISDGPRDLTASQVTPRTAVLSWKPPVSTITGYKLSYSTDGQESEEVAVDPAVTELKLRRLNPSSSYTARLRPDSGGPSISTQFSTGSLRFPFPSDCWQEQQNGALESGVVEVFPQGRQGAPRMVYCDMETDGGGWTVFQRRKDGKTNFFRSWREYSSGFGALDGEFWFGNELLHNFTQTPVILRVDLRAGDESVYARYSSFSVENAKKHFAIRVSGYSGTAGDSMSYHNGRPFSTRDRDPQPFITRCAMSYRGGWWYKNCHEANLNGLYNTSTNHQGVIWTAWKGKDFSIPFTEMKFRPASFRP